MAAQPKLLDRRGRPRNRSWEDAVAIANLNIIARFFGARSSGEAYAWCKSRGYVLGRTRLRVTNTGWMAIEVLGVHGIATTEELDYYVAADLDASGLDGRAEWSGG